GRGGSSPDAPRDGPVEPTHPESGESPPRAIAPAGGRSGRVAARLLGGPPPRALAPRLPRVRLPGAVPRRDADVWGHRERPGLRPDDSPRVASGAASSPMGYAYIRPHISYRSCHGTDQIGHTHGKHCRADPLLTRERRDGLREVADPRIARQREDVPRIDDRAGGGQDALHRHARRARGAELRLYAVVLEHRGREA